MLKRYERKKRRNTILLLDDEDKLLEALSKYLKIKNFNVLTASSVRMALQLIKKISPDLLIVDVMIPLETGYDFVSSLKKINNQSNIPFIFLTGKGMTHDRIKGYSMGCEGYITKPFDPEELVTVINNIISKNKKLTHMEKIKCKIKKIRFILEEKNSIYIQFTPREKTILIEMTKGVSNKQIADNMKTGLRNVESYVTRILRKTMCKNRVELIKFSYRFHKYLKANDGNRTRE